MYHSMRDFLDDRRRSRKFEELRASAGPGASMRRQDIELEDSTLVALASSVTAGFVVHTLTSPIWVVKTRLQLQSGDRLLYSGVRDCMVKLYEREGARGFYKGLSASYMGLSETGAQFAMYERMKRVLQNYRFRSQPAGGPARNPGDIDLNPHEYFAVASFAKLLASVVTYPHEVVRTRLREQSSDRRYRGFFHTLGTIAREEGRVGLYGGMGAHLLRVVPNAALLFVTYEAVLKLLTPPAADTSRS
jgi:solute carrier family 25, member 33/36